MDMEIGERIDMLKYTSVLISQFTRNFSAYCVLNFCFSDYSRTHPILPSSITDIHFKLCHIYTNSCMFIYIVEWGQKAKRRRTTGTGRMNHLKDMPRRFKNGFREGNYIYIIIAYVTFITCVLKIDFHYIYIYIIN